MLADAFPVDAADEGRNTRTEFVPGVAVETVVRLMWALPFGYPTLAYLPWPN